MNLLARLAYNFHTRSRNPKINAHVRFLEASQFWPREKLEERQLELLKRIVDIAYRRTPFYRGLYTQAGITPQDVQSLDDLNKLPVIDKSQLCEDLKQIQIREADSKQRMLYTETNGTTGMPLAFYRDDDWQAWNQAALVRGYHWHGVEPWQRYGYVDEFIDSILGRLSTGVSDSLHNRFRLVSYTDRDMDRFIGKLRRAKHLGGRSSMIYEVAKAINRIPNIEPFTNLKLVRGTSEKVLDSYQSEASQAFGRRIVNEYSAAEAGVIAFECPQGSMHVTSECCIVECVDGEILVTNLVSSSLPIIRYRLGDSIDYRPLARCACGRAHPVIGEVTGRAGQLIRGYQNSYPSLILYSVFKNLAEQQVTLNYAANQERAGLMQLLIEQSMTGHEHRMLTYELQKYFGTDLDIQVIPESDLRTRQRQSRDFVSSLS